jgi:serine/threonine protein kinase
MSEPLDSQVRWDRVLALFNQLLENGSPGQNLAEEPDPEIREAAGNLWRRHLQAENEEFLSESLPLVIPPVFAPDQVLNNRFRIERILGAGGMGEVYLALDLRLNEKVALKTIGRSLMLSEHARRRFLSEIQNARRVTHLNVCRIYDLFDEGEVPFFAMEYISGNSLADLLKEPIPEDQAKRCVLQMARGLHAAHESAIVHGDFKPANVMISQSHPRRVVITDFGLARAFTEEGTIGRLREHSITGGTPEFMAPELNDGAIPSVEADIYAFGKVAQKLLPNDSRWEDCVSPHAERRPKSLASVIDRIEGKNSRRLFVGAILAATATGGAAYKFGSLVGGAAVLESGARILVNVFQSQSGDRRWAGLTRSLFLTSLRQSPRIRAIADQDLQPALHRMSADRMLPISGDALSQLVQLQRAAYWVDGTLSHAGERFGIQLQLFRSSDRRVVHKLNLQGIPNSIALAQQAAEQFRLAAGESTASLEKNARAISGFVSAIPEATEKYYEALEHYSVGDNNDAIPLLEDAIRLDDRFPQPYHVLGMCLNTIRRHGEALEKVQKSMDLSGELPIRERSWIEADYYLLAEDPQKMIEAGRKNLGFYPDEPRFFRQLAYMFCRTGNATDSLPYSRRGAELAPQDELTRLDLIVNLSEAGQFQNGLDEYNLARQQGMQSAILERGAGLAHMGLGDYERALHAFEMLPGATSWRMTESARIMSGNLTSALSGLAQYLALSQVERVVADQHQAHEFLCGTLFLTGQAAQAWEHAGPMAHIDALPLFSKQLQCAVFWAGWTRHADGLKEAHAKLAFVAQRWPNGQTQAAEAYAAAIEKLSKGDSANAEKLLLASLGYLPSTWALFDLAVLFSRTGKADQAEEQWARFDARRGTILKLWFPGLLVWSWLHRAGAAASRGDRRAQAQYSKKVLDHWADRNPHIGVVKSAQTLLERSRT